MPIKLTGEVLKRLVTDLEAGREERDLELPGFGVRPGGPGRLTYTVVVREDGKKRRISVGHYPDMKPDEARRKARAVLDEARRPVAPPDARLTVRELAERFLAEDAGASADRLRERRRVFELDVYPVLGERYANAVRRGEIVELLDAIVRRGAPIQANRTRGHILRLFNWAVERDLVPGNPVSGSRRPAPERSRDRTLSAEELRTAFEFFEELEPALRLSFAFRTVTLQRGGEVSTMGPDHIAGDWWTIPAPLTKMKRRPHRVFLSPFALDVLSRARALKISTPTLFFPSPRTGLPYEKGSPANAIRRLLRAHGVDAWTPHDLRRTPGDFVLRAGFSEFALSVVLGHTKSGEDAAPRVTGAYARHRYDELKRDLALCWERILLTILQGGDVAATVERERQRQRGQGLA
jgi:integrase